MKNLFSLAALTVVLILSAASIALVDGRTHTSFTEVFVSDTGNFRIFSIANTGGADLYVRFSIGDNTIAALSTDSVCVPAGMSWSPPNDGDIGTTAKAYWLSSVGTTAVTSFD